VQAKDLIEVPKGEITEEGLRWNIDVGLSTSFMLRDRLRSDLPTDGRCGDCGDLPRPGCNGCGTARTSKTAGW